MTPKLERLAQGVETLLGIKTRERLGELTVEVTAADYKAACEKLKTDLQFEQLIDLCGVDYASYGDRPRQGPRFAVVAHLLSVAQNWRLRLRAFCPNDEFPVMPSLIDVWPAANWFEREAFDLYGIVFEGHPDLRRILTDYGFVGHPFRKDFPLSGYVEMRYDPEQRRVLYQPVTIDPREVTPRVVRQEHYADDRDEP
jgi:NADH-quinone oxidoreductase subunit C